MKVTALFERIVAMTCLAAAISLLSLTVFLIAEEGDIDKDSALLMLLLGPLAVIFIPPLRSERCLFLGPMITSCCGIIACIIVFYERSNLFFFLHLLYAGSTFVLLAVIGSFFGFMAIKTAVGAAALEEEEKESGKTEVEGGTTLEEAEKESEETEFDFIRPKR